MNAPETVQRPPRNSARDNRHEFIYLIEAGACSPCFLLVWAMLIVKRYRIEIKPDGTREVCSAERPKCPVCGSPLSGYDRRRRSVVQGDGSKITYLLRRLYCQDCKRLHLEIPDCIAPQKHYAAQLIAETVAGTIDYCPADNSTIRRWKK